jgi:adenosylcobyric acid synthase
LLPFATKFQQQKRYRHVSHTLAPLTGFWESLSGATFEAYEIRHGQTRPTASPGSEFNRELRPVLADHCGWQYGQTLALYLHGMLESPQVMHALFGQQTPTLDDTLNGLADFIDGRFAPGTLMSLLQHG